MFIVSSLVLRVCTVQNSVFYVKLFGQWEYFEFIDVADSAHVVQCSINIVRSGCCRCAGGASVVIEVNHDERRSTSDLMARQFALRKKNVLY
jgi:hypothetical protein